MRSRLAGLGDQSAQRVSIGCPTVPAGICRHVGAIRCDSLPWAAAARLLPPRLSQHGWFERGSSQDTAVQRVPEGQILLRDVSEGSVAGRGACHSVQEVIGNQRSFFLWNSALPAGQTSWSQLHVVEPCIAWSQRTTSLSIGGDCAASNFTFLHV